jgi:hypothetical protein
VANTEARNTPESEEKTPTQGFPRKIINFSAVISGILPGFIFSLSAEMLVEEGEGESEKISEVFEVKSLHELVHLGWGGSTAEVQVNLKIKINVLFLTLFMMKNQYFEVKFMEHLTDKVFKTFEIIFSAGELTESAQDSVSRGQIADFLSRFLMGLTRMKRGVWAFLSTGLFLRIFENFHEFS